MLQFFLSTVPSWVPQVFLGMHALALALAFLFSPLERWKVCRDTRVEHLQTVSTEGHAPRNLWVGQILTSILISFCINFELF